MIKSIKNKTAVIDIGSNSVRLMTDAASLDKKMITTRLGTLSGSLDAERMQKTLEAVSCFIDTAKQGGAAKIYIFATAAVRNAGNGGEFCRMVKARTGIEVDILTAAEEAAAAALGVLGTGSGAVIDLGGASTEVTALKSGKTVFSQSINIGAVTLYSRVKDLCGDTQTCSRKTLQAAIDDALKELSNCPPSPQFFAVGGTATTLVAVILGEYSQKIHGFEITRDKLSQLTDMLFTKTVRQIKDLNGMDKDRADIISGGALLLLTVCKKLSIQSITVSLKDNLDGYLPLRNLNI